MKFKKNSLKPIQRDVDALWESLFGWHSHKLLSRNKRVVTTRSKPDKEAGILPLKQSEERRYS